MSLSLPPHVQKRIDLERRAEYHAALWRNCTIEDDRAREYTAKLQLFNRDLFMVRAHDKVELGVPLRPGFYHMIERIPDAPANVVPLTNGDAYAEPGDWIFAALARGNLRERRVRDTLKEQEKAVQDAVVKEQRTRDEDRREKLREIVLSATRAQVSMDRSIPWTQSSDGRRGGKT
jgi:hypothetical protein